MLPLPTKTSPPIKTPIYSNTHSYRGTRSTTAPLTFLLIAGILGTTAVIASTGTEYVRVYLAIAVSTRVDIIYK